MKKILLKFGLVIIPVIIMITLIPYVRDDIVLTVLYIAIICFALIPGFSRKDLITFALGFVVLTVLELFFISTGVETFNRISLFGAMPLWLPFLWAYSFVAIRKTIILFNLI